MASTQFTLTFLGAAETVTGSKYLINYGDHQLMVDAGMFQGDKKWRRQNWAEFPVPPASIEQILLTHAHMDHCGYLPALVKKGFNGPIWCTYGTAKLAEIVLRDAGRLEENEAEDAIRGGYSKHNPPEPLYTEADVEATLPLLKIIDYGTTLDLGDGLRARFVRAGHILGSASIRLWVGDDPSDSVIFSGDLGRHEHPVLQSRQTPVGARSVVIESTYGDREHPKTGDHPHQELADAISRTIARGGSVLIPAFAVDRTEIVLTMLGELQANRRIPTVPIYMDSPMGTAALNVYQDPKLHAEMSPELDPQAFLLPNLHEVRDRAGSIALNTPKQPCLIISSSGMASGGRVVHHLEHMLPNPHNCVVFTGYQAVGTRGRDLVEGASQLKMFGRYVPVKAEVIQDDEFSVHADGADLIDWLSDLNPQPTTVYCTHGEAESIAVLTQRIRSELGLVAVTATFGEVVRI